MRTRSWQIVGEKGIDGLALNTRTLPAPAAHQVLVRVESSSLNYRDLSTVLDPKARGLPYPAVPNSDCAGEIVAVGDAVSRVAVGDRVAGCFFQRWIDGDISADAMSSALGGAADGVLGEHVLLSDQGVVHIPEHLNWSQAACLPCAGVTAWHCLMESGEIDAGDTVLLLGTGGVSIMALQMAVARGASVIITSSSDDKLARAGALGAWQTINYRKNPQWDAAVLELTDGKGADFCLETGGGGTIERSINAVRVGGRIGLIGVLTDGQMNPTPIMRKSIRLQGIYVGSRRMFEDMNRFLARHQITPVVDAHFGFEQAREAFHHLRGAAHFGKIAIDMQ